jgi:acyl-CoA thioester hydrolase
MAQPAMTETSARHTEAPAGRAAFAALHPIATRWLDNDAYGHVNNVVYYSWFDTAVNAVLVNAGLLDIAEGPTIGLVVESGCRYLRPLAFPEPVEIGVRIGHIGRSSVRWELAVFGAGVAEPAATGFFVHVYVDRSTRRPAPLAEAWLHVLRRLVVDGNGHGR